MRLCFAALIKVLKICAKPKIYNKTLVEAVIKSLDVYYGGILGSDDGAVSRLMSCDNNLSPDNVVTPARTADLSRVSQGIRDYVLEILDENKIKIAMLALQDLAKQDNLDANTAIGRMKYSDLIRKTSFNPADFIGDIFIYTATSVENKDGKSGIGSVNKAYVMGFEAQSGAVTLDESVIVETEELECTLDADEFCAVFREVEHSEALQLKNASELKLYYLDISDSAFDYEAVGEYLLDCAGMYVYNRTQIKDFEDRHKVRSMGAKALRQMQQNGHPDEKGTGNELGEMLLFTFMEGALHAPKLLSKVEIVATSGTFNSKSDSVHLLKRRVNGVTTYQLVFGTSAINNDIKSGIDTAISSIVEIKSGKKQERRMVDSTLLNRTYDDETTAHLRQILIPTRERMQSPDMAFGVFVAYSIGVESEDNDEYREAVVAKMISDIQSLAPYIAGKIAEANLGMHSYYFYFLPLNNAEEDKKRIMSELLGGIPE